MQTPAGLPSFLRESSAALLVRYRNDDSVSIQIRTRLTDVVPWEWPKLDNMISLLNANLAESDAPNIESFEPLSSTQSYPYPWHESNHDEEGSQQGFASRPSDVHRCS